MAENEGFEPSRPVTSLRAFQARPFSHLGNSPAANVIITRNLSLVIKKRKYFIFFVKMGCLISYLMKRCYNKLDLEVYYARNNH